MQIDWLTVVAQIFNFLILVWLLKRFLYQPIIDAMHKREQGIAESIHRAELREREAEDSIHIYQNKLGELEQEAEQFIERARQAAQTEQSVLLEEARSTADEKRAQWQRQIEEEKQNFLGNLKNLAAQSVEAMARRALSDLAQQQLEVHIIHSFVEKLDNLDDESFQAISSSASSSPVSPIQITTSFELDLATKEQLSNLIQKRAGSSADVRFSESLELICGVELTAPGIRLSWTIADYLEKFEQRMQTELDKDIGTATA